MNLLAQLHQVSPVLSHELLLWTAGALGTALMSLQLWRTLTQPREPHKIEQPIQVSQVDAPVGRTEWRLMQESCNERFAGVDHRLVRTEEEPRKIRREVKEDLAAVQALIRDETGRLHSRISLLEHEIGRLLGGMERLGSEMAALLGEIRKGRA